MAPSSDGYNITTRGEAPALAQHAHTTVFTLFLEHDSWPLAESRQQGEDFYWAEAEDF